MEFKIINIDDSEVKLECKEKLDIISNIKGLSKNLGDILLNVKRTYVNTKFVYIDTIVYNEYNALISKDEVVSVEILGRIVTKSLSVKKLHITIHNDLSPLYTKIFKMFGSDTPINREQVETLQDYLEDLKMMIHHYYFGKQPYVYIVDKSNKVFEGNETIFYHESYEDYLDNTYLIIMGKSSDGYIDLSIKGITDTISRFNFVAKNNVGNYIEQEKIIIRDVLIKRENLIMSSPNHLHEITKIINRLKQANVLSVIERIFAKMPIKMNGHSTVIYKRNRLLDSGSKLTVYYFIDKFIVVDVDNGYIDEYDMIEMGKEKYVEVLVRHLGLKAEVSRELKEVLTKVYLFNRKI